MQGVGTTTTMSNVKTLLTEKERGKVQEQSGGLIHNIRNVNQSAEKVPSSAVFFKAAKLLDVGRIISPSIVPHASPRTKFNDKTGSFINKLNNDKVIALDDLVMPPISRTYIFQ